MSVESVFEHLRKFASEFNAPPGYTRPEISQNEITMMMSPSSRHQLIARRLRVDLDPQVQQSHPGYVAETGPGVEDPARGILRYPDLIVAEEAAMETLAEGIDPAAVMLAAEIVSPSNPENDYVGKLRDYPAMGIEHYLIVDPREGVVIHHFAPEAAAYANTLKYAFGDTVPVGPWNIGTTGFLRYADPTTPH